MNKKVNEELLKAAKEYLEQGFSVIPVGIDKKPLVQWKEFQSKKASEKELVKWFSNPDAVGVAIVTGKISGLSVLDCEVGADSSDLEIDDEGNGAETVMVKSGGNGKHYYYNYPQDKSLGSCNRIFNLIDLKSDGGYVIAPPSLHKSGNKYEWLKSPKEVAFLEFPDWVLEKYQKDKESASSKDLGKLLKGVTEGSRNESATSVAGKLMYYLPEQEWETVVWQYLISWNLNNSPPLPPDELRSVFDSIAKKELKNREAKLEDLNSNLQTNMLTGKREIVSVKDPENEITKEQWDKIIKENFPELHTIAEIELSVIGQLLIKDVVNPFGLVLVDVPSSGKTIALNFFSGIEELVFGLDNFTPSSFVSHASNKKAKDLEGIDLLPKIKDRMLLVRDLAPIFGLRDDDLLRNMAILTRVFDGEGLETASGVHGRRGYQGCYTFMFLGASTPIPPKIWKLMSGLGARLFFVNVGSEEKEDKILTDQLISGSYKLKENICRSATADFVRSQWKKFPNGIEWDNTETAEDLIRSIVRIAKMLARLRGRVSVWPVSDKGGESESEDMKLTHSIPIIEKPDRISQTLYNFARGHAVINGRRALNSEDLNLTLKIALESAAFHRSKLFKKLIGNGGKINSEEVERFLNCSRPTALKEMETLKHLDLVGKRTFMKEGIGEMTEIYLRSDFQWLLEVRRKWPDAFRI